MIFKLLHTDATGKARSGSVRTAHGEFHTPAFMPVGTIGTVKTLAPEELRDCRVEIMLSNTYHLYLRPGLDVLRHFGGLHGFNGWKGPILTDSGGFQIYSLDELKRSARRGWRSNPIGTAPAISSPRRTWSIFSAPSDRIS